MVAVIAVAATVFIAVTDVVVVVAATVFIAVTDVVVACFFLFTFFCNSTDAS